MLHKIWNDPVWSKVVAGIILAALAIVWVWIAPLLDWLWSAWEFLKLTKTWLTANIATPRWLLILSWLLVGIFGFLTFYVRRRYFRFRNRIAAALELPTQGASETNPEPAKRPAVDRPFDRLSRQQKSFVIQRFRSGTRQFSMEHEASKMRWFEELANWRYVEAQQLLMYSGGPWPYEVCEGAWQELELLDKVGVLNASAI